MARIRTIKPEFWSSEQVMSCSPLARLLFIGIWNFCDDGGNHPMAPRTIKALVFPGDDITVVAVEGLLGELHTCNLIALYDADGKTYLHVQGWNHQKIDKRTFKYPAFIAPPDESSPSGRRVLEEESPNSSRGLTPGREREGNGEDQHHTHSAPESFSTDQPRLDVFEGFFERDDEAQDEQEERTFDPKQPVEMTLDWMPDANLLKTYCVHFGVSTDLFTKEAVAPFTAHHETAGTLETQAKWVSLLVRWVKGDSKRASNVRPFQKPVTQSRHNGFAERDYTAGLTLREDGSYAL